MIADLKPYPAYKDSGVEWLGDVPKRWDTLPLKHWVTINAEVLPETTDPDRVFRYVDIGSVGTGSLTQKPQRLLFARAPSRARRIAHNGDTLVSTVRTYLKAIYFVQGEADEIVCSTGFAVLTPRVGTVPQFVSYLVRSNAFTDRVTADSVGTAYPAIAESRLGSFHVPSPPLPEQAAIVRFLDHADRRIRRYIRTKQKLIALLEEQKQAIIHQAVTGQIDVRTGLPYPAYKPSGVEWLGDVPEHWEVRRIKTLCSMKSGDGITTMSIEPTGEYPVYGGNGLRGYTSNYTHDGNFALIGRQGALCGNVHIARGQFWASEHAVVVTIHSDHVLEWFGAILGVMNLNQYSIAAAQPGLAVERVLNLWVPVPPSEEQAVIATDIEQQTAYIDVTVNRDHRQISFLREYRTRLITDVVTGKLDVREAAAQLPDEVKELEPLDEAEVLINGEEEPSDGLGTTPEEAAV